MKNLKKSLALVLAVIMVFSLCVFANAEFADQDEIGEKYELACGIMNGLTILEGDNNGVFNPKGNLTRGQACKIVACLKLGPDVAKKLSCSTDPFDDVPATEWYAPYVAYCKGAGIVNGYGNGCFGPNDMLSGYAWGKILLTAIGYGANSEYTGEGWDIRVAADALPKGIYAGDNTGATLDLITREQAALYAYNAMQIDTVQYLKVLEMYTGKGYTLAYMLDIDTYDIGYVDCVYSTDEDGRPVTLYYNADYSKVLYTSAAEPVFTSTDGKFTEAAFTAQKKFDFVSNPAVYKLNGEASSPAVIESKPGMQVEFFGIPSADGKSTKIIDVVATQYYYGTITGINDTTKAIDLTIVVSGTPYSTTIMPDADEYAFFAGCVKGDVFAVEACSTGIIDAVKATAVAGKVTALDTTSYTIDTAKYVKDNQWNGSTVALGQEGTLYLGPTGYALGFVAKTVAPIPAVIFYAVKGYTKTTTDEYNTTITSYYVQGVDDKGAEVSYKVATAWADTDCKKLYTVAVAPNGIATLTLAGTALPGVAVPATALKIADNNYYASDVKFIYVDGNLSTLKIAVKDAKQAIASTDTGYFYATGAGTNKDVKVVFVNGTVAVTPDYSKIAYGAETAASTSQAYGLDGKTPVWNHVVYINGVKTDVTTTSATAITGFNSFAVDEKTGAYTFTAYTTNVKAGAITNAYNGLITVGTDVDVKAVDATIINVSGNAKANGLTGATLATTETVTFILGSGNATSVVYITGSTRT